MASLQLRENARAAAATEALQALARNAAAGDTRAAFAVALLQAQVLQATGQTARALAQLDAITAPPSPRPLLLARAQAALDASRSGNIAALRASTEALQTWVAERRNDATAWALLAQCAEGLGLRLRAMRADAEAHAALGDIGGAIERLRAAQRLARSDTAHPTSSKPRSSTRACAT